MTGSRLSEVKICPPARALMLQGKWPKLLADTEGRMTSSVVSVTVLLLPPGFVELPSPTYCIRQKTANWSACTSSNSTRNVDVASPSRHIAQWDLVYLF